MTSISRARGAGPVSKVLAAAALWGVSGVVARNLFQRAVDPSHLVQIRMLLGGAALLPLLAWHRSLRVPRPLWPALAGYAALMALLQLSYFEAIAAAGVAVAVFLQYTAPLLVAAWESIRARSLPPRPVAAALALAVAGSALLVLPGGSLRVPLSGFAWGLTSAAAMAAATVVSGALRRRGLGALPLVAWGFLLGSLAFAPRRAPWTALATVPDWPYFLYVAVFATAVPFALYVSALGALAGTVTMLLAMLEPALAAALAWLFLGEALSAAQLAGGLLILAGVALAAATARR